MLRRMLLGLVIGAAACGAVAAQPPGLQPNPHLEGRELDPVTRDFYLSDPPAAPGEDPAPAREPDALAGPDALWALLLGTYEAIANEFTMQLGTAELPNAGM